MILKNILEIEKLTKSKIRAKKNSLSIFLSTVSKSKPKVIFCSKQVSEHCAFSLTFDHFLREGIGEGGGSGDGQHILLKEKPFKPKGKGVFGDFQGALN